MEGPPDAKRQRLDHEQHAAYPASIPLPRPATTPATASQSHPYSDHPPPGSAPPNHTYQPPPGGSQPPPAAHPPVPVSRPYSRDLGPDPRNHTSYPPSTTQPGYQEPQTGYAVSHTHRPRSFSTDPPRATPAEQRGHQQPPAGRDRMELHVQSQVYQQQLEQHPNGAVNGLPYPQQAEQYSHHQSYPPTPVAAYPPAHPFHQGPGPTNYGAGPRRKQVRATQACNNCRQRKQKCDEQKPCSYCKNESLECEYREVPPPKTDRAMQELMAEQRKTQDGVSRLEKKVEEFMWKMMNGFQPGSATPDVNSDRKIVLGESSDTASTARSRATTGHGDYTQIPHLEYQQQQNRNFNTGTLSSDAPITLSRVGTGHVELRQPRRDEDLENQRDEAPSHHTGAQYLINWPIISGFFKQAGVKRKEYVQEEEDKQDTLRPYGGSWLLEAEEPVLTPMSPPPSTTQGEHVPMWSPPCEGSWGTEFRRTREPDTNVGGLNPDGSLCLDEHVVRGLWDSYMRNMWTMHPFMDARWLKEAIGNFVRKHSPAGHRAQHSPASRFAVPSSPTGSKRKHPDDDAPSWTPPTKTPERSMENAIILLVLALGKVLQEDGFLLQKAPTTASTPQSYNNSPRVYSSPRPHGNAPSPAGGSGRGTAGSSHDGRGRKVYRRHIDMYPGLAYFAYASDILGNNHGGNEIMHAQAFLLAGLYLGQLGRVLESWTWIYDCFRVATMLRARHDAELYDRQNDPDPLVMSERTPLTDECTTISLLCWSALQLESDLRAELESLPKPGNLMFSEPTVRRPDNLIGMKDDPHAPFETLPGKYIIPYDIWWHYSTQIQLRLTLNRVHTALYSNNSSEPLRSPWADASASGLWAAIHTHRSLFKQARHDSHYGWNDGDPPAGDLLNARLRAKYYGAAYIIFRPYISTALLWQDVSRIFPESRLRHWRQNEYDPNAVHPELPQKHLGPADVENDEELAKIFLWCCMKAIESAMHSTVAFDGLADPTSWKRMKVTNIHGTATAQFSNMLVLCAVAKSWLHPFVEIDKIRELMDRTMQLHRKLCPLAPVFITTGKVLKAANEALNSPPGPIMQPTHASLRWHTHGSHGSQGSPQSMHGSQSSAPSPALSHTPVDTTQYSYPRGPTSSAHTSFGGQ